MRILVAEDQKPLARHVCAGLREAGFTVDLVHTGEEALKLAMERQYVALVLDIVMPGRDGLSILRLLREKRDGVPILIVSERKELSERVEGLMLGADDYLTKPFALEELVARVHALARRASKELFSVLNVHDLSMNLLSREVRRNGVLIELAPREFALLECLMRSAGRALSRTYLIENVWDYHFDTGTNVVDVYIQRLRRKIDDNQQVKLLKTIRGIGYVVRAPE